MAYENFIPQVWSETIERELSRCMVFGEDCNREYEGTIKDKGESVKILGVGKPTIKSIVKENKNNDIDGPETIEDTSVILPVNQIRYFNYMVGDIDKAQSNGNIMDVLSKETSEGLAGAMDSYIAALAGSAQVHKLFETPSRIVDGESKVTEGEKYVLDVVDEAVEWLLEHDVSTSTRIVVTVSPKFRRRFVKAYRGEDTDNSKIMKNGVIAEYGNVIVKVSNNVYKTTSGADTVDNIMIRTQRAIAFVNPLTHTEAYRPEKKFADAIKGFTLFDAKIVRPKEIVNINVTY